MQKWNNKGIRFVDDIVETYCNLFTVKGSAEERQLRLRLNKATESKGKSVQSLAA